MPEWLKSLDANTIKAFLNLLISFSSGFLIGATEIISTFQYRKKLFKMPSVYFFLSFYGLLGLVAFVLLTFQDEAHWINPAVAFAAGIGPHVILRSRFTIIRSRDEKGEKKLDLSLDLEKVFTTWEKFFKNRIDVIYAQDQQKLIDRLIQKYPTTQDMRREVSKLLYSLRALEPEDRKTKMTEVEVIFEDAEDLHDEICLHRLAGLIVRMSDFDALDEVLTRDKERQDPADAFLKNYPDFLDRIDLWKETLSEKERQYLDEKILSTSMTEKGKSRAAAKFLVSRKKQSDVISFIERG